MASLMKRLCLIFGLLLCVVGHSVAHGQQSMTDVQMRELLAKEGQDVVMLVGSLKQVGGTEGVKLAAKRFKADGAVFLHVPKVGDTGGKALPDGLHFGVVEMRRFKLVRYQDLRPETRSGE